MIPVIGALATSGRNAVKYGDDALAAAPGPTTSPPQAEAEIIGAPAGCTPPITTPPNAAEPDRPRSR